MLRGFWFQIKGLEFLKGAVVAKAGPIDELGVFFVGMLCVGFVDQAVQQRLTPWMTFRTSFHRFWL